MRVGVLGINYKSSELKVRETLAKTAQAHVNQEYGSLHNFSYVLLSTCNRTEIYFSSEDLAAAHSDLLTLLRTDVDLAFEHCLYSYFGYECFSHLAKVTAGFDSVIFGETEIQRQVKQAYETACSFQSLPSCMHYMFQKALKVGKNIRSQFELPRHRASIEGTLFDLSEAFFLKPKTPSVLFIGNSEINRKVLSHFKSQGIHDIALATRAPLAAAVLMQKYKVRLLSWEDLPSWTTFDMVVCGTNQKDYLLKKEDAIAYAEPVSVIPTSLIIDLSMPRSVDPKLGTHPQISLFNIEEINAFVDQKQKLNKSEWEEMKGCMQYAINRQLRCYQDKQKKVDSCALFSL